MVNLMDLLSKKEEWQDTVTYEPVRLMKGVDQIPEGAVRMSTDQVLTMQAKRLSTWQPESDVWPFKYGKAIVGMTAAVSGLLVNNHFRTKFVLRNFSRTGSYVPVVVLPTFMAMFVQETISRRVMLMPDCPTCIETRAGTLQVLSSVGYSIVLAPLLSIFLSRRYHTYLLKNNFQPNMIHAVKATPFARNCFVLLTALNFGVGYLTAYFQGQALETIVLKEARLIAQTALDEPDI